MDKHVVLSTRLEYLISRSMSTDLLREPDQRDLNLEFHSASVARDINFPMLHDRGRGFSAFHQHLLAFQVSVSIDFSCMRLQPCLPDDQVLGNPTLVIASISIHQYSIHPQGLTAQVSWTFHHDFGTQSLAEASAMLRVLCL